MPIGEAELCHRDVEVCVGGNVLDPGMNELMVSWLNQLLKMDAYIGEYEKITSIFSLLLANRTLKKVLVACTYWGCIVITV